MLLGTRSPTAPVCFEVWVRAWVRAGVRSSTLCPDLCSPVTRDVALLVTCAFVFHAYIALTHHPHARAPGRRGCGRRSHCKEAQRPPAAPAHAAVPWRKSFCDSYRSQLSRSESLLFATQRRGRWGKHARARVCACECRRKRLSSKSTLKYIEIVFFVRWRGCYEPARNWL